MYPTIWPYCCGLSLAAAGAGSGSAAQLMSMSLPDASIPPGATTVGNTTARPFSTSGSGPADSTSMLVYPIVFSTGFCVMMVVHSSLFHAGQRLP